MTDSTKPRMTLDLDEIERQIRQASQNAPAPRSNDPLAELARIVGHDDPFKSLLSSETPAPRRLNTDGLFHEPVDRAVPPPPPPLRGSYEDLPPAETRIDPSFEQFLAAESQRVTPGPGAFPPPPPQDDRFYDQVEYDPKAYAPAAAYEDEEVPAREEAAPPKSRKSLYIVGAILGVAAVGVTGALTLGGGNVGRGSGEPPVVKADAGPNKVAPQTPGGLEIPNQNKQIYERTQGDANSKIVNREEQPVDVRQAARVVLAPPGQAGVNANPNPPPPVAGLGEPRRVRTVSVRPDGSIVGDEPAAAPAPAPAPAPVRVASAPPAAVAPQASTPAAPVSTPLVIPPATTASSPPAGGLPAAAAGSATATTTGASANQVVAPALPPPRPRDARPATATPAPAEAVTTASTPEKQQQRLASVAPPPATPAAPATPAPAAAATTSSGGFAVQLAVRPSEREARDAFDQFSRRYSELSGMQPIIRRAEVNGSTIYRVRVGPLGREDAVSLCERLKAAGGQCFVARN